MLAGLGRPGVATKGAGQLGHGGLSGQGGHLGVGTGTGMPAQHGHLVLGELARLQGRGGVGQFGQSPGQGHQAPGPAP